MYWPGFSTLVRYKKWNLGINTGGAFGYRFTTNRDLGYQHKRYFIRQEVDKTRHSGEAISNGAAPLPSSKAATI